MKSNPRINRTVVAIITLLALAIFQAPAGATYIDFSQDQNGVALAAGTTITSQYDDWFTLTVDSNGGYDTGMIFDSAHPTGEDPDLETPSWANKGNAQNESLGNVLIISEDGNSNDPDDEARGGSILFDFSSSYGIDSFGFHVVDIDDSSAYTVDLYDGSTWKNGLDLQGSNLEFGDNSINKIDPYLASQQGLSPFRQVRINLGGSGAIDNVTFGAAPVPEPATMILFGSGLIGLAGIGRRQVRQAAVAA